MGNSSSVYATARPLEGSVEDFTNGQKASDMMYRKMGADKDEAIAKQKIADNVLTERKNKEVDDRYGGLLKSDGKFTKNVQELSMNTMSILGDRLVVLKELIKDNSLPEETRNKYRAEGDNILRQPEMMKIAGENLNTAYASHLKDVQERKAYLNTQLRDAATLGYGATAIWDSEKNQVVYAVKQKGADGSDVMGEDGLPMMQDTNKDGKVDKLDYIGLNDLIADTGKFKSEERYEPATVFKTLKANISTQQVTRNDGTIETVYVNPSKEQATEIVNRYFLTSNGSLTAMGKSMLIEDKRDYNDPKQVEEFMSKYANDLVGTKNTKSTSKQVTSDNTIANQDKETVRESEAPVFNKYGKQMFNPDGTPVIKRTKNVSSKQNKGSGKTNTNTTNNGGKVR